MRKKAIDKVTEDWKLLLAASFLKGYSTMTAGAIATMSPRCSTKSRPRLTRWRRGDFRQVSWATGRNRAAAA
jgi:hypothetical protein